MIKYPETIDSIYQIYRDSIDSIKMKQWNEEDYIGKSDKSIQFHTVLLELSNSIKAEQNLTNQEIHDKYSLNELKICSSCKGISIDELAIDLDILIPILGITITDILGIGGMSIGDTFQINP